MTGVVPDRIRHPTMSSSDIQAPSPEMGMASLVDKAVTSSDYREPEGSDDQEPKVRTIRNANAPYRHKNTRQFPPLTILTDNPSGLLLTANAGARVLSAMDGPGPARLAIWQVQLFKPLAKS